MNRMGDVGLLRAFLGRGSDSLQRALRYQSPYSWVSALLPGALVITFVVGLLAGSPQTNRDASVLWLMSFAILTAVPLVAGKRYPRWAGLVMVGYLSLWSAYFVTQTAFVRVEINALLEVPMFALYLGWFYRPWPARAMLAFSSVSIALAVLFRIELFDRGFSSTVAVAYTVFIAGFCLETGSYLQRRTERIALLDPLTQVLNRRGLVEEGTRAVDAAHRAGIPITVAMIDFDDFKAVNDNGGHAAGDEALCVSADSWVEGLGAKDLVARSGGDEFALLIHASKEEADARLAEIRSSAEYAWSWGSTQLRQGDSLDELLSRADARMYRAKERRDE